MASDHPIRLPDFIGLGPPRTGTTWLHRMLVGHVDLPYGVKETQFFTTFYSKGVEWYARHFRYATGERKIAEICPYFNAMKAPVRIRRHLPDCKFLVTFRNPVDHAYSSYKMLRRGAFVRGTFDEVLNTRPNIDDSNRYARQLAAWFEHFDRERFLIMRYEELRDDPQDYLDRVCDFIGTARIPISAQAREQRQVNVIERAPKNRKLAQNARHLRYWLKRRHAYGVIRTLGRTGIWEFCNGRGEIFAPLSHEQRARLTERYLPEVEALEEMLKTDFSEWKNPGAAPRRALAIGAERS
ncbi:MAG: sulfotransferase family protein [Candidatus Binatus sp.]